MLRNRKKVSPIPLVMKNTTKDGYLFQNNDNIELDAYQYAASEIQRQLPLPSQSVKIPYRQHPERFVSINQKNRELDHIKSQIQRKCELEELHYQAKIQQMKQQNFLHRQKLEQLLMGSQGNPAITDQYRFYGLKKPRLTSNNQRNEISQRNEVNNNKTNSAYSVNFQDRQMTKEQKIQMLLKQKQKILDQIDKIKIEGTQPVKLKKKIEIASDDSSQSSDDLQKRKSRAEQLKSELDYIYNRNQKKQKTGNNKYFEKKPLKEEVDEGADKRLQYDWVRKVRNAKKHNFQIDNISSSSDDSSEYTQSEKSKKIDLILDRKDPSQNKSKAPQTQRITQQKVSQKPYISQRKNTHNDIGKSTRNVLETYRGPNQPISRRQKYISNPIYEQQSIEQESRLQRPSKLREHNRKIHYINPKLAQQQRQKSYIQMYEANRNRKSRISYNRSSRSESYYENPKNSRY